MIGLTVSRYKILEKIGSGGMGVVYKAEDLKLHRIVALKFLPLEYTSDEDAKNRFFNEAYTASSLQHNNIYTIHDIEKTEEGQFFICMDYYDGETLKKKLSSGKLDHKEAIGILLQITEGLKKAHLNGIVHRDIKPANIFITKDGLVKILDFGIAKLYRTSIVTNNENLAGTIAYMSPEQANGEQIDQRTDIWSIGVLLYEMLSGKLPFSGEYNQAIIYSILNDEPEEIDELKGTGYEGLFNIIKKCLRKAPVSRYQKIDELEEELKVFQRNNNLEPTYNSKKHFYQRFTLPILIFLAILFVVYFWLNNTNKLLPLNNSEKIIVSDFINKTGEKNFDNSLSLAMRVSLSQSPLINIIPSERLGDVLIRMGKSPDSKINDTLASEIARRERIRIIIAGEIYQLGKKYILLGKIIDAVKGEPVELIRKESSLIEEVLAKMDELCSDLRSSLGESLNQISKYKTPIEKATTRSLDALELYSKGDLLEAEGDYQQAAVLKEKAYVIDTLFTLAISDLSFIYRKLGMDSLAFFYHRKVPSLLPRVTERERLNILSIYYGPSFEFNIPKALQFVRQLVSLYPYEPIGHLTLGWLSMYTGDTKTAVEAGKNSIAIDSSMSGTVFNNIAYSLALGGQITEAHKYFLKSKKIRPNYTAIDAYIGQLLWMEEKLDSSEAVLKSLLLSEDPYRKVLTYIQLISLYYFQGRLSKADSLCVNAIDYAHKNSMGNKAYLHYLRAEIAADQLNMNLYKKEMKNAVDISRSPFLEMPLAGVSYARYGFNDHAKNILIKLAEIKSSDSYFLKRREHFQHLIKGEIFLAGKKYNESIDELKKVEEIHKGDPYFLTAQRGIAECYIGLKDKKAAFFLNSLLEKKYEATMGFIRSMYNTGFWIRSIWPEMHLELGKQLFFQNRYPEAKYHFEKCIEFWKKADKNFDKLKESSDYLAKVFKQIEK